MNKMIVFLDDIRIPSMSHRQDKGLGSEFSDAEKWTIVRDFFEFKHVVDNYFDQIELVSFDHDLACVKDEVEYTGKTAADYLVNYCLDHNKNLPSWYVHSDNISGKNNIIGSLLSYLKNIEGKEFPNFRYYHNGIVNNEPV